MSITVNGIDELKKLAGSDLGTSEWIEVTQERINTFADATGDHQWIHVDPEKAAEGPFGAPIAHGYLTLSLFIPLFTELLDVEGVIDEGQLRPEQGAFPVAGEGRVEDPAGGQAGVGGGRAGRRADHGRRHDRDRGRAQAGGRPAEPFPFLRLNAPLYA